MEEYSKVTKCLYCGKEFEKSNSRRKYCSGRCKEMHRLSRLQLCEGKCKGCGKPITYRLKAGKPTRQYCSVSCQLKHTVPVKRLTCVDCGKVFEFVGRTIKLRCEECRRKHRSKTIMLGRALKDKSVQLGVGSGGCQNKELDLPSETRRALNAGRRRYYAENADRMRAIARSRYRDKALLLSQSCDICGYSKHQEALVVHHKDMDRANNASGNLAVLCANCHTVLHKEIKRRQKTETVSSVDIYDQMRRAEIKSRNKAETPVRAIRTEGCGEPQSGATHTGRSGTDISRHEAATDRTADQQFLF